MHIDRQSNLLGALAIGLGDLIRSTAEFEAGLAGPDQAAIVALSTFLEGGTIVQLSRLCGLSHSATVRLVDRLVDQALVERRAGTDRREVALYATRAGRALGRRILSAREEALKSILGTLPPRRRDQLTPILEDLLAALVGQDADPCRICRMCNAEACGHYVGSCPVTEASRELSSQPGL